MGAVHVNTVHLINDPPVFLEINTSITFMPRFTLLFIVSLPLCAFYLTIGLPYAVSG